MDTKRCNRCEQELPLDSFGPHRTGKLGRYGICRACCNKARKERYRAKHPLSESKWVQEGMRQCAECLKILPEDQFFRSYCKPCHKVRSQRYFKEHPEALARYAKQDRARHPERYRGYDQNSQLRRRVSTARRQGLKILSGEKFTLQDIAKRDSWTCGICDLPVAPGDASIDHIVPLSKGGQHTQENVQLAHGSCNSRKHTRLNFRLVK